MKSPSLLLHMGALMLASAAPAQSTASTPSDLAGFHQITVAANSSKVVGANFVRPLVATGRLEASTANTLIDDDASFTTALSSGVTYWVEITSGANKGIASSVNSFTEHTLVTEDNLATLCGPSDTYEVRPVHTVASLFGATNSAGLKTGTSGADADTIQIPDGQGGLITVYYSSVAPAGWRNALTGTADAAGTPIYHVDAVKITHKTSADLKVRFAGILRTNPTHYGILPGINQVDINYPVGSTLANCTLQGQIKQGDSTTGDLIWIPNPTSGYKRYYYSPAVPPQAEGWRQVGSSSTNLGATTLTPGIVIERRDAATNMRILPDPTIYDSL